MLDVHKLALLREVALHGSVTAAARSLQMSTSNISQRLSRLEQETGVRLLETVGRGVILTDAAWQLVAQTEDILAALVSEGTAAVDEAGKYIRVGEAA